jgi:hypothetical protein
MEIGRGRGKWKRKGARCQWLTPIISSSQEAEIRRITVQSQPGQIVFETLSQKRAQGDGPEVKLQYCKAKEKEKGLLGVGKDTTEGSEGRCNIIKVHYTHV